MAFHARPERMRSLPSRGLAALLLVILASAPLAAAGTREAPEVTDAAGDASPPVANAWADLARAWVEPGEAGGVEVHIEVASAASVPAGTAYILVFDVGNATRYAGFFQTTVQDFGTGDWDRAGGRPTSLDDAEGSATPGSPLRIQVSVDEVADARQVMSGLTLYSLDFKASLPDKDQGYVVLDEAASALTFSLPAAAPPDAGSPGADSTAPPTDAQRVPGAGLLLVLATLGLCARRTAVRR